MGGGTTLTHGTKQRAALPNGLVDTYYCCRSSVILMYASSMTAVTRTAVSLPVDLAEWAKARGGGNFSSYLADLIRADKRRVDLAEMFEGHGYVGDKAITESGVDVARTRLHGLRARRHNRGQTAA
jgi:hypothetical protein